MGWNVETVLSHPDDKTCMRYLAAMFLLELHEHEKLETCPEDIQNAVNSAQKEMADLGDDALPMEEFLRYALGIRH